MGKILQILIIENRDLAHAQTFCTRVMPENFLEINRYFALTSYCNTIAQWNNAFPYHIHDIWRKNEEVSSFKCIKKNWENTKYDVPLLAVSYSYSIRAVA